MGEESETRGSGNRPFFRDGVITLVVLLLVFAAFDDITTDNATAFPVEYSFLVVCGAWLLSLAWRLSRQRHRFLGGMSVLAVAAAVWAQRAIGPGIVSGFRLEYVAITAAYLWFSALSLTLLWLGWRSHHSGHRETA
jgi:hypothetical protein